MGPCLICSYNLKKRIRLRALLILFVLSRCSTGSYKLVVYVEYQGTSSSGLPWLNEWLLFMSCYVVKPRCFIFNVLRHNNLWSLLQLLIVSLACHSVGVVVLVLMTEHYWTAVILLIREFSQYFQAMLKPHHTPVYSAIWLEIWISALSD